MTPASETATFPQTTWSSARAALDRSDAGYRAGIEVLCRRYWGPIRHYAQRSMRHLGAEDSNDLAQEFFLWLLEAPVLARYDAERGSFRNYLKGLLRGFFQNRRRAALAQRRGGGRRRAVLFEDSISVDPRHARAGAEEAFERAWRQEVLDRAIAGLRERSGADERRRVAFCVFEEYDLARPGDEPLSYAELGAKLGLRESQVRTALFSMRAKLREAIKLELTDTVSSRRELEEEWSLVTGAA